MILAEPKNLPHKAKIKRGDEKLSRDVAAIVDDNGYYLGPMLAWNVVTAQVQMAKNVQEVTEIVSSASTQLQNTAQSLSATAEQTTQQAAALAAAPEHSSAPVHTVASSAAELSRSHARLARTRPLQATQPQPMRRRSPFSTSGPNGGTGSLR